MLFHYYLWNEYKLHIILYIYYIDHQHKILNHLKAQCVLEGTEEDFYKIVESIKLLIINREKETEERKHDDSLVVNPRDITRL